MIQGFYNAGLVEGPWPSATLWWSFVTGLLTIRYCYLHELSSKYHWFPDVTNQLRFIKRYSNKKLLDPQIYQDYVKLNQFTKKKGIFCFSDKSQIAHAICICYMYFMIWLYTKHRNLWISKLLVHFTKNGLMQSKFDVNTQPNFEQIVCAKKRVMVPSVGELLIEYWFTMIYP